MTQAKPKYDARAGYSVDGFQLSAEHREQIAALYPKHSFNDEFWTDIENAISKYVSYRRWHEESAGKASILAALEELGSVSAALIDKIQHCDGKTARLIEVTALEANLPLTLNIREGVVNILCMFKSTVRATERDFKEGTGIKGRPKDPKQFYVDDLFRIWRNHGLKPKASAGSTFEQALDILMVIAGEPITGAENILRLIKSATKRVNK